MKSKNASYIRGKLVRTTRLNTAGSPVFGEGGSAVSTGFVSVEMTANVEEGEAINGTNANGDTCTSAPAAPSHQGLGVEIVFCEVDFAMFQMITGNPVVLDEDGNAVGIDESTEIRLSDIAFALEIWLGVDDKSNLPIKAGSEGVWGYFLLPFLSGGIVSDITVENDAINFTVNNINSRNGARWGVGPYNVDIVDGEPSPLRTPVRSRTFRRFQRVELAPPRVYAGGLPLLDPSDDTLTTVAVSGTGMEATFTPTGAGPVFYDLGDDTWDYSESGTYTHMYEEEGTYEVVAMRGLSKVTETVTVPQA